MNSAETRLTWTDAKIETLKKLWADGLSASQIAAELGGVSRNGVIGKAHRLGLNGRKRAAAIVSAKRRSPRSVNPFGRKGAASIKWRTAAPDIDPDKIRDIPPDQSDHAIPFMQATAEHCRWPLGEPTHDMLICGDKPMDGKPYCARHCKIAYQPIKPRVNTSHFWTEHQSRRARRAA